MRLPPVPIAALVLCAAALDPHHLLARAKPAPNVEGTFVVRQTACAGSITDQALGDCSGPYASTDGTVVFLNTNREFRGTLASPRFMRLDLSNLSSGGTCGGDCAWAFGSSVEAAVHMQTNVVTGGNVETVGGLMRLDELGESDYSRFYFTFPDPAGRGFNWSLLFNDAEYPDSDLVRVTNIGTCTWRIEAPPGTKAGLRGWTAVKKGRGGATNEGLFEMTFALEFSAPGCAG